MAGPLITGRRSRLEIISEVLATCVPDGVNKTAIMYQNNLSYAQLERYLDLLQEHGLLERNDSGRYQITEEGEKMLEQLEGAITALQDLIEMPA